jgi:hypothetical protein
MSNRSQLPIAGRFLRLRRTAKLAGVTVVLGLAAAGISSAAIPDSTGLIHGCYNTPRRTT